jgi:hypothetical protein
LTALTFVQEMPELLSNASGTKTNASEPLSRAIPVSALLTVQSSMLRLRLRNDNLLSATQTPFQILSRCGKKLMNCDIETLCGNPVERDTRVVDSTIVCSHCIAVSEKKVRAQCCERVQVQLHVPQIRLRFHLNSTGLPIGIRG